MILLIVGLFFISFTTAAQSSLGTFKQNECVDLLQTCSSCSYNNISGVFAPDSTKLLGETVMEASGTVYNYTFCSTNHIGIYQVTGHGDLSGTDTAWTYDFEVTPSGSGFLNSLWLFAIILLISGVLIVWGFNIQDPWVIIFGTIGLYFVGLYSLLNGIAGVKDMVTTWAISLTLLGIAAYLSIRAGLEVVNG